MSNTSKKRQESGEDIVFADNYFDITCKEGVETEFAKCELKKTYGAKEIEDALLATIISVGDSF